MESNGSNDLRPLNLGAFKDEFEKKNSEDRTQEQSLRRDVTINPFKIEEINTTLYSCNGTLPYFLDDMKVLELSEPEEPSHYDTEGEEWKKDLPIENTWQEEIDKMKELNNGKPFEIVFPYKSRDRFKKMGIIPDTYSDHLFYVPDNYMQDVKKYNEHVTHKAAKEAADDFASLVKRINYN